MDEINYMIRSKSDYLLYLYEDKKSLGKNSSRLVAGIREYLFPDYIWKFQKLMRKYEYYSNCKNDILSKLVRLFLKIRYRRISYKLGFSIPINTFGPGLSIAHYGTIVVNGNSRIGANCRIHASTNIGASNGSTRAPRIGSNVYIGPGAIIFGDISIPNNTLIGANSTVNKSFVEENTMIAGSPAKVIKNIDVRTIFKNLR